MDIVKILKENIAKAGFGHESTVIKGSAFNIELKIAPGGQKCDLVFIDPPYAKSKDIQPGSTLAGLLDSLNEKVKDNGIVVVRTSSEVVLLENYGSLQVIERRKWGTMAVTIFRSKVS